MREGSNPQKAEEKIQLPYNHRVIIVVFIPELKGYYENSLDVFKLCLSSLIKTNTNSYAITVVNNGSCKEVSDYLKENLRYNNIDSLISHNQNIGKIDALIGAARGAREELITVTDADILFTSKWNIKVEEVFKKVPNVGSVSPIPFRHGLFYGTSSVLKEILLNRVQFELIEIPENFENQNKYLQSINWGREKNVKIKWPVIKRNNFKAIIGSGHQILTIRRTIFFKYTPTAPALTLVGGDSEYKYIDEAIDKSGLMRLSTYHNYAYHMGNVTEGWMKKSYDSICIQGLKYEPLKLNAIKDGIYLDNKFFHRFYVLKKNFFKKIFRLKYFKKLNSL
jgi:hypothetical protein